MTDLGNGISVDFPDKPSVFLIKGYGEIRVQKGNTRINGVSMRQFALIAKILRLKKEVKDGQEPDIADVKQTTPRKARTTRSRSSKP